MLWDWWVRKSLHRPGLTPAYGLRRAKVVFSAPSILFCIYHLYKFRELSSFYLQNYFPQRTGEERINLHRPGLTSAYGLRRAKVGFWFPTIPFLYYEYKIRNISIFYSLEFYFSQRAGEGRKSLHRRGLTSAYGLRRDISRVWANRGAERRMGATHHLVLNVRFRESKSTVKVKSVFRHHPFPSLP